MADENIPICSECGQDLTIINAIDRLSLQIKDCVRRFNRENGVKIHTLLIEDGEISKVKWHDPSPPIPGIHLLEN